MQSLEAELWALRDGLELAHSMHLRPLEVEMDALAAIQLIMGPNQPYHLLSDIVHDCRCSMDRLRVEKIENSFRGGNR